MANTKENYENRYLEEIKSKGFIQKLKHDAKSKNCAASQRLYTRVKKSFKNKDKKRRLNKNENILLYNTMTRNGNAKFTRHKSCVGNFVLDVNLVNLQKQTLAGPIISSETFTGSQHFSTSNLLDTTTTRDKVSSWLMYNLNTIPSSPLHIDPHRTMEDYSDIYPPSYSFKDNYHPVNLNKQKVNVFHVEKGKPNGVFMEEHVLGVTDDNFRYGGNDLNHKIHQCIWCPCVFFFTVLCCIPAILLMTKADKYFLKKDMKEATWHQKMSTRLYVGGFIATILFYIAIALFVVCFM
ncbi:hypothetical protein ACF0H5_009065 [Mactra antiquata]